MQVESFVSGSLRGEELLSLDASRVILLSLFEHQR